MRLVVVHQLVGAIEEPGRAEHERLPAPRYVGLEQDARPAQGAIGERKRDAAHVFIAIYASNIWLSSVIAPAWTALLLTATGCANVGIPAAFLGGEAGYQLYLIPLAGLTVWMTRGGQWPVPLGIAALSVAAFVYIKVAFDEGLVAPYSDLVLDGLFATSIVGAVGLAVISPLLYRELIARTEADLRDARARRAPFLCHPPASHRLPARGKRRCLRADHRRSLRVCDGAVR